MDFEIVTDSCCNLSAEMIDDLSLHVLPLSFMANDDETVYYSYLKGQSIDLSQFYDMMRDGKVFTTSLPSQVTSKQLLIDLLDAGKDILYLGFSSGLSGTYEAISSLMAELSPQYPLRKLYSVDTLCASGGQGLLVWHAAKIAKGGASIEYVRDWAEDNKLHLAHWFTVDDLMFLFRGGRVSRTSAWAGSLLNIKPVMHVDNEGKLVPLEKVRGRKKSLNALLDHMEKTAQAPIEDQMIFITHGDCKDDADYVATLIKERFATDTIVINCIDPVIGAHSGPGTLALFFLASER